jgi:hypothetical protein
MAIRDKMRKNAAPFLEPGEKIQVIFGAQTHDPYLGLIFAIFLFLNTYRVVVVTDRRILVCRSGKLTPTPAKEVLSELPRNTRIGTPSGRLWWRTEGLGEPLYIGRRYHKDVEQADKKRHTRTERP